MADEKNVVSTDESGKPNVPNAKTTGYDNNGAAKKEDKRGQIADEQA